MTECGRCHKKIKEGEKSRESMHYGKIHNSCHDKMLASLANKK